MNIRDLKYIIAVAKEQNFARAAELSAVSQPALSMQIKKLEDELEVQIFERSHKNFLVTKTGEEIIRKAEEILLKVDEIKNIAKSSKDPYSGEIRIGAFPTLAPYFFPKIIGKITRDFPKLKIFLIEEKTEILIEKIEKGEIDAAFIAVPCSDPNLSFKKIFSEDFLLAVPKGHPLTNNKRITHNDLNGHELMLLEEGHCMRDQALEICSIFGAREYQNNKQNFRATSLETLKQMIISGNGITLVPEIAAAKDKNISYLKLTHKPQRTIGFYFRKTSARKDLFEKIAETVKEIL